MSLIRIVQLALFVHFSISIALAQDKAEVFVQLGHRSAISAVSVSSNGNKVASGSLDGFIKLWDADSGREIKTLEGHQGSVQGLAFSPDGKQIASIGRDRTLRLWNSSTGVSQSVVSAHENIALAIAFSNDGKKIITGSFDKAVKVWDASSARSIYAIELQSSPVRSIAINKEDNLLAIGAEDGVVKIYNFPSGTLAATLPGHTNGVLGLAFSPTNKVLATAGQDGIIKLWNAVTFKEINKISAHNGPANSVNFSFDGKWVASAGQDGLVKLWNANNGNLVTVLSGHTGDVQSVAFAAASPTLVSGGIDKSIRIWNYDSSDATAKQILKSRAIEVRALSASNDGKYLAAAGSDGFVRIWDNLSGRVLKTWMAHQGAVEAIKFSPDGKSVATGGQDKLAKLWDWLKGNELKSYVGHKGPVTSIAFSSDGSMISTGSNDTSIRMWDVATAELMKELNGHRLAVRSVAISPDGKLLASAGSDDMVKLWNISSGSNTKTYIDHSNRVTSVAFSVDSQQLLSASEDSTLRVRDLSKESASQVLTGHKGPVRGLAVMNSNLAASVSVDGTLSIWDYKKYTRVTSKNMAAGQLSAVTNLGNSIAVGGDGGATVIVSLSDAVEKLRQFAFSNEMWVSITPEGYFLASEGGDKFLNVRIKDQVHGLDQFIESFYSPDRVRTALVSDIKPASSSTNEVNRFPFVVPSIAKKEEEKPALTNKPTPQTLVQVKPAPKVVIENLPNLVNSEEISVELNITDLGGGVGDVRLYLNGSAIALESTRNLVVVSNVQAVSKRFKVRLANGKNTIKAIAFNDDNSMQSNEALFEIEARLATARKPSVHALVIGIEKFNNPRLNLEFSVSDAKLFADVIKDHSPGLFETVNVRLLVNPQETTKDSLIAAMNEIQKTVHPEDLFVFYVASHGTVDEGEYFLVTSNVGATSTARLRQDAIPQTLLKELLGNVPATKKLIVLDTCNSGQMVAQDMQSKFQTRGLSEDRATKILSRSVGSTVLSAATSQQEALEGYKGHGLFTWVVAEGLKGKADLDKDGYVKTTEIADYVDSVVPELAEQNFQRKQFPVTSPTGQQFPLVKVKK